jgi:hypothetical protein
MRHAGSVREKITNGDMTSLRAVRKPRDVFRNRRVQVETALSRQQIDNRLGHHLVD